MNHFPPAFVCHAMAASLILRGLSANAGACEAINKTAASSIVELLVSDRPEEVARGESDLAAQRSSLLRGLLERIQAGDPAAKGKAACELGLMISPWIRGKESGARFYEFTSFMGPRRPVGKVPQLAESGAIRHAIQGAVPMLIDRAAIEPAQFHWVVEALKALCETLGEVADDQTMDWAIDRLREIKSSALAEPLLALADSYLGIPPVFRNGAICGNASPAEMERFRGSQELALTEARTRLAAMWREIRPMENRGRITFAIKSWRDHFVPIQRSSSGRYLHEGWLFMEMEPLIRLGAPVVEVLRAQQALETSLETKAVWEVVVATITGREDAALLRTLFDGNTADLELACEIVVGAVSKKWLRELEELQRRGAFDAGKASRAIASCHRDEGIPALQRGFAWNSGNFHAKYALKELDVRASRGSPRGMRRYLFP